MGNHLLFIMNFAHREQIVGRLIIDFLLLTTEKNFGGVITHYYKYFIYLILKI